MTTKYVIIRKFHKTPGQNMIIKRGVSLQDAKAHCTNPEACSKTAADLTAHILTRHFGPWSDSYQQDTDN